MTEGRAVIAGGLGLVAVIVLGLVAGELGGVTIRSASRTHAVRALNVTTTALVPGVPVRLIIDEAAGVGEAVLVLRGASASARARVMSPPETPLGVWMARVPCELSAGETEVVRWLLLDADRGQVLAQSRPLKLLKPGPDCAW